MEKYGIASVPIPTNESQWDQNTAQAAGLGTIGRHSLLITPEFGSMVWLGAVLCDQELEQDDRQEKFVMIAIYA